MTTTILGEPGMPSLDEVLASATVVAIPTRTRFRGITVREAVIFDAPNGPSEFSPFPEYDDREAATWLAAAIDFGWDTVPALQRQTIEVNATVPAVEADRVPEILARFPGCRTAKVKVAEHGQTLADDIARVRRVRELLDAEFGDAARVRIDANGGWSVDEAERALHELAGFDLEYAEQPCMTVDELVALRARLGRGKETPLVRIAADESVRKTDDPVAVARSGAADLIVVKAQPLGGVRRALAVVEEAGLPVVVSSALDTSVGVSMGLRLAAALPEGRLAGACGLGTVALLDGDVTADPLLPRDGEIEVRRTALDRTLLTQYSASTDRDRWWRSRIERCSAQLV